MRKWFVSPPPQSVVPWRLSREKLRHGLTSPSHTWPLALSTEPRPSKKYFKDRESPNSSPVTSTPWPAQSQMLFSGGESCPSINGKSCGTSIVPNPRSNIAHRPHPQQEAEGVGQELEVILRLSQGVKYSFVSLPCIRVGQLGSQPRVGSRRLGSSSIQLGVSLTNVDSR
jgi:hypothetical protein